ncbi:hypothetical protein HanRHA438_Chr16g0754771 [Helianthus annuus]|uniref:Uncharacterized protein n=1 Tax=Helianthus annuus TaxID=4232 RepID=A0A251RY16_HELAN|nr:hypothetical protein HanXRQr2_Chr16g0742761 [Helianthus annuus]KAJ0442307.1 hypothetical protein HanIR_Chr16g0807641 [Helianthus annuus]KAJ0820801.1 hypothetical protein HanPSC8_Chr16g0712311 [Helianthus annuus]KAJ0835402.1 hypothetical protein HanRHA438_Chr16g0754771 [Helianthus annuus]
MKWSPYLIPMLGLYESPYLLSLSQSSQGPTNHLGVLKHDDEGLNAKSLSSSTFEIRKLGF